MARIFGIVLILLAIYYGLSIYNGDDGSGAAAPAEAADTAQDPQSAQPSGQAAPTAVTSRVRDRVNAAVAEGYHHSTGE
jgi:hypothetical protein